MIIKTFKVVGLYDVIDADIIFHDDMNIIVGRNGAGKTSVLALLSSLIRIDIEAIKAMSFDSAVLTMLTDELEEIKIESSNRIDNPFISIKWIRFDTVQIPLVDPEYLYRQSMRRLASRDSTTPSRLAAAQNQMDLFQQWNLVCTEFQRLAKLTFVRLDRTILAMDASGIEALDSSSMGARERTRVIQKKDPIDEVVRVTQGKYIDFRNQVDAIRADAYKEMMRLHFSPIKPLGKKANILQLRKKLIQLKSRVTGSALTADVHSITSDFFDSLEMLLKQTEDQTQKKRTGRKSLAEESIQLMLELKERQTEELLNIFETAQQRMEDARSPIKKYLDTLTKFLSESGKEIQFSDESFQLTYTIPAAGEGAKNQGLPLKDLSSGERQIIIVLTYLAFMSGSNSIFIIDEPELSLHLRWQSYLVDALRDLRPVGGQIIVATHAPEIAGRSRDRSIQLTQKYLPVLHKRLHE